MARDAERTKGAGTVDKRVEESFVGLPWILEAAHQFLSSPVWQEKVDKFVEASSDLFAAVDDGFTPAQFESWSSFQKLVQDQLGAFIASIGVDPVALVRALTFEDFPSYARMMHAHDQDTRGAMEKRECLRPKSVLRFRFIELNE